jgi:uncharacterized protein YgbK (DUF1537 family)
MHPVDNERFMQVLALADDLTGALEVGAKFAARGMTAIVANASDVPADAPVVVINTESRHLAPDEAGLAVSAVAATAAPIVYKKTDSTLRGNIRAELEALARLHPEARIAYVPAYPAMNRTVRGGHLFVDGIPVNETSFARDPLNPVTESSVARVLGDRLQCTIFDGETTEDIVRAAAAILQDPRYRILAGPAALAEAIAAILAVPPQVPVRWPAIARCLVVNGSLHERSTQQIECAIASGAASVAGTASWRVLQTNASAGAPLDIAHQTGDEVRGIFAEAHFDALLVFGGDTASAILTALACSRLRPLGELVEGVPISQVEGRDLHLVTKAGGFGDVDVICRVRAILDRNKAT